MKVLITDHGFSHTDAEKAVFLALGAELKVAQCKTPADVISAAEDADALLVQWAPVDAEVISRLGRCKVIVRYGIGVDNVDLAAARTKGIVVCNVPDYCVDEVAEHTIALALALARQVQAVDSRVRAGTWKIVPDRPVRAFRQMLLATAGFGRIARGVLARAKNLNFRVGAHDPFAADDAFRELGVARLSLDDLFAEADVLSLHSPLTSETRHLVNQDRLKRMKPTAIVINTARGGLINTGDLVTALKAGTIGGAGLDVFETEPLPLDAPIRACSNVILTSHVAWFSEASVPQLQRLAAEEAARVLRGEAPRHRVN